MEYSFSAARQALLAAGKLVQAKTVDGLLLPFLKDPATGMIVEVAKGVTKFSLQPFIAPAQAVLGSLNIIQTHLGFQETYKRLDVIKQTLQSLQSSLGVLQSTTAIIGVGTFTGVALTAVNLKQTLKLRQEVEQFRLEVKDGFIDIKCILHNQTEEIIEQIKRSQQDSEYQKKRQALTKAYCSFITALDRFRTALNIQNKERFNTEIDAVRSTLFNDVISVYNDRNLLNSLTPIERFRWLECFWTVENAIITTYQIQDEMIAVSQLLSELKIKMRQDILNLIDQISTDDELNFLFPEITHLHNHDFPVLETWQSNIDYRLSLKPLEQKRLSEQKILPEVNFNIEDVVNSNLSIEFIPEVLPEELEYSKLKKKCDILSLKEQLRLLMNPQIRLEYTAYISRQATRYNYESLVSENLEEASNFALANLYYYFKDFEE